MTIRKKWILTLGIIALISILINSFLISFMISRYFNQYLDENYDNTCNEITAYLSEEIGRGDYTESKINSKIESYLSDLVSGIKVYDTKGNIIGEVDISEITSSGHSMGMMNNMMNSRDLDNQVVDSISIEYGGEVVGEVHIIRDSSTNDSYDVKMFQNSLVKNGIISLTIVFIIVIFLGWIMSRRVSRDLVSTAEMAQNLDMGLKSNIKYSGTKEIGVIQNSLESLGSRLRLKQKARKTMVDEMVHQTRTPLTILKMHIEGFEDGVIDFNKEEFKICQDQIENLSNIINNIGSLIEDGENNKKITIEDFELRSFITQIINGLNNQFKKKNISIKLLENNDLIIRSDKYRLGQSLYNIITNAYKYTDVGGSVNISYKFSDGRTIIEVEDNGSGILEKDISKIFNAYYKGEHDQNENSQGLGLYIAKENIKEINGDIKVQSEKNKGTKFTILLDEIKTT